MTDPANLFLTRIREAMAGTYDLLGEIGHDERGTPMYLARTHATGALVAASVKQDDADGTEFTVEVRRTLGVTVAVEGSTCPECGTTLHDLERFCFHCGADLSGVATPDGSPEETRLLAALASATAGRYEILGRMEREDHAGTVYFARDLSSGRISALRLRRAEPGDGVQAEYVVNQTRVFRGPSAAPPAIARANPPANAPANAAVNGAAVASGAAASVAAATTADAHSASGNASSNAFSNASTNAGASGAHGSYAGGTPVSSAGVARAQKSAWMSRAVIGSAAVVLLSVAGYFAFKSDSGSEVAAAPPVAAPAPAPAPLPAPDSTSVASTPGAGGADTMAAALPSAPVVDSGTLRLVTPLPQGARVTIDGRAVRGRTFRVASGSHVLAITAPGHDNFTQRMNVRPGSDARWAPRLVATVATTTTPPTPIPDTQRPRGSCRSAVRAEDWTQAFSLCTNEATAGDIAAASSLARLYARGLGTRRSASEAFTWYSKAAAGGDREAQTALGYALRDGVEVKRDPAQSVRWFKAAAEQGDRLAQLEYAVALERGDGTGKNEKEARVWYAKAAEQGNFMAARRLAKMIERGAGGPRSDADAAAAYERAATLGDPESAMTIARWYRDGRGVAKSNEKALTFFRKAAELGNREAEAEIRRLDKGEE